MRMAMKRSSSASVIIFAAPIVVIAVTLMACANNEIPRPGENPVPPKSIDTVIEENNSRLLSIPGVVGTAESLCDDRTCIKVYVIKKSPELTRQIPKVIDGYPVVIEETGEINVLPEYPGKGT